MSELITPKTDWDDADPVSSDDLNRIESNIYALYERNYTARQSLAAALRYMGRDIPVDISEVSFEDLIDEVNDISKDATAETGDVLANKTFYSGGIKKTGILVAETLS